MTTPITDHDAGDESDFKFKEVVGLTGPEAVVPSTGKWMFLDDPEDQPPPPTPEVQKRIEDFLDNHKEGAD